MSGLGVKLNNHTNTTRAWRQPRVGTWGYEMVNKYVLSERQTLDLQNKRVKGGGLGAQ